MKRYEPLFELPFVEDLLLEGFTTGAKPNSDGGRYIVKSAMGRQKDKNGKTTKKFVKGWVKTLKKSVKPKTKGMTASERKRSARKAVLTKKKNPTAMKKANLKRVATMKKNKK